jgi:hypothetical protein
MEEKTVSAYANYLKCEAIFNTQRKLKGEINGELFFKLLNHTNIPF